MRRSTKARRRRLGVGLLACAAGLAWAVGRRVGEPAARARPPAWAWDGLGEVPLAGSANAQWELADAARADWRGRGSPPRGREAVARAYAAVADRHPASVELAARAAFRCAELVRAGGDDERAGVRWRQVVALAPDTTWALRARIELGHAARRRSDLRSALELYEGVACEDAATPALRDVAADWCGRSLDLMGQRASARRWWRRLASGAQAASIRARAAERSSSAPDPAASHACPPEVAREIPSPPPIGYP